MKIRGRLIIAFLIITAFPFAMISICFSLILNNQSSILEDSYSINTNSTSFIFNPLQTIYDITTKDFTNLVAVADSTPDQFIDKQYLDALNHSLKDRDSFIVIKRASNDYYVGNKALFHKISSLPSFYCYHRGASNTLYIDRSIPALIKEKDITFSDKTKGQVFLITNLNHLMPQWRNSIEQLTIALFCIILATAFLLMLWIYSGIIKPLHTLKIATMQIGNGNLDQPIPVEHNDEIGDLCKDFEEMRVRLKNLIKERIQYEHEIRDMMSSISHDLQTPLTAIKGYAEGIIDGVADNDEKRDKYLRTIYTKANDMTYLVDELSVFAKIERNSLPYNFVAFNLDEYFQDCFEDISFDLEMKKIDLNYFNYADKNTSVLADPEQLKRVLNNIIGNTVKYLGGRHGTINVRIQMFPYEKPKPPLYRQINADGSDVFPIPEPDRFVQIQIEDNGPGISKEDIPYIFDQFYRADASRNSSKRGSGLGLAIVKKIIEDHGGRVWADGKEGVGTSIFFLLKAVETE